MTLCGNIFRSILALALYSILAIVKSVSRGGRGGGFGSWQQEARGMPEKQKDMVSYSPY